MVLKYIGLRGFQVHSRAKSLQEIDENTRELSSLEHRRFHGLLTSAAEQQGAYLSVLLRASGFSPALGHIAKYHLSTETRYARALAFSLSAILSNCSLSLSLSLAILLPEPFPTNHIATRAWTLRRAHWSMTLS